MSDQNAIRSVHAVHAEDKDGLPEPARGWARATQFAAKPGEVLLVPGADGGLAAAVLGLGARKDASASTSLLTGALATALPAGRWRLDCELDPDLAALGFRLGGYRFDRYRRNGQAAADGPQLDVVGSGGHEIRLYEGIALVRDLINTPANDMGPDAIERATRDLAAEFGAAVEVTTGDALLAANLPMIHAVGRASQRAPRLIDMRFGRHDAPRITLVGKGVAFDTGGLDIKPASGMLLMKKDMGGAANVLGLARMLMAGRADIALRVLIPAVENSISGDAFRPGDVLTSRKGRTVEIGNTDAEGRLVLADALTLADEEAPELLVDMATLTGAARVALGPDLPPFYTDDEELAAELARAAAVLADPMWRMPLWAPYAANLSSRVADINNVTSDGFAGSVTAALFLQGFVERARSWVHFDVFGWRPKAVAWGGVGGEAQCIRALSSIILDRYGQ
ncbi:leucyl aminopeptidase family protein [Aureimonas altamirensis]|uniref:leucyl aminopeptidase family protein n=1 Tax=Aureimonas altamirensis TaxID=370622 RepID=UPI003016AB40